jgi:hypothetical protein
MTRALYRLQGILTNVEKQPFDGSREPCLSKIKQNIYDVEDILDELENGSFRAQRSSRGWKLAEASDLWSQVRSMGILGTYIFCSLNFDPKKYP